MPDGCGYISNGETYWLNQKQTQHKKITDNREPQGGEDMRLSPVYVVQCKR